jgi:RimJ/RimL family protein N-acetyltransferase
MLITDVKLVLPMVADKVEALFPTEAVTGIGWEHDGRVVAGVVYDHFTGTSIQATIAAERGTYMRKEFVWAIFDYPFNQLGVGKILVNVEETNKASLGFLKRSGFIKEAYIEGVFPSGAMIIMSLTKENCVWLERLHHGQEN